jgi:hypothetical protein
VHPGGDPFWGNDSVYDDKCWEFDGVYWGTQSYDWDMCVYPPMQQVAAKESCGCALHQTFWDSNEVAGFNIYRWSNMNCQYDFHRTTYNSSTDLYTFNLATPRIGYYTDTLMAEAEAHGFNQICAVVNGSWACSGLRSAHPPQTPVPIDDPKMDFWKDLWKYVIDRWGVYMDVFEFFNEAIWGSCVKDGFYQVAVPYIRSIDPYDHLITTSHWSPGRNDMDTLFDIRNRHQYFTDAATSLDNTFWNNYNNHVLLPEADIPFLMGEAGNKEPYINYHPNRYRVVTWMAFMTQQHMVYWYQSQKIQEPPGRAINNQYIGLEERVYNKIFTNITQDFPIDHQSAKVTTSQPAKVRGYTLTAPDQLLAYFYYYADRPVTLSGLDDDTGPVLSDVTVTLNVPAGADQAQWIDPTTGNIDQTIPVTPGSHQFTIPDIMIDKVLKIGSSTATVSNSEIGHSDLGMRLNCFPNPFSTSVEIAIIRHNAQGRNQNAKLRIYDVSGKQVYTSPVDYRTSLVWDSSNQSAGVYIVELKSKTMVLQKKVTLIK